MLGLGRLIHCLDYEEDKHEHEGQADESQQQRTVGKPPGRHRNADDEAGDGDPDASTHDAQAAFRIGS